MVPSHKATNFIGVVAEGCLAAQRLKTGALPLVLPPHLPVACNLEELSKAELPAPSLTCLPPSGWARPSSASLRMLDGARGASLESKFQSRVATMENALPLFITSLTLASDGTQRRPSPGILNSLAGI